MVPVIDMAEADPLGRLRGRQALVQRFAEQLGDEAFLPGLDPESRAALVAAGDDMAQLLETAESALEAWGEEKRRLDRLQARLDAGEGFDGHHTHNELYAQRMLYHAHLAQRWAAEGVPVVKSRRHHTGEECFGGAWFIVVMQLPTGQVSQHYPMRDWDLFRVPEEPLAPVWDGHTPQVGAERLRAALALLPSNPAMMQRRCSKPVGHDPHLYSVSLVCWCATGDRQ